MTTKCLGILPYKVRKFESTALKIPQMGWNNIFDLKSNLFNGVAENSYVYFVHSFYVESGAETIAMCDYGVNFSAAVQHKNFYAVQFHAEKSGAVGERILENFFKSICRDNRIKQGNLNMIEIIPAIDLIDGKCVRLSQGDFAQKKIYSENPLEVAKEFEDKRFAAASYC